ncbi:hypothetical protein ScalyP_jg7670 [Parmales sp. scaly parma]|nr:hypothetical protein ScalyP_jg7670 [Parmales sp. scaly parma]
MPRVKEPQKPVRALFVKTKVCQRMVKEVAAYELEVSENEAKLAAMKADSSKDEWDEKKFAEVLAESYMMIPDSKSRMNKSLEELALFLEQNENEEGIKEDEWYATAKDILATYYIAEKENVTKTVWAENENSADEVF